LGENPRLRFCGRNHNEGFGEETTMKLFRFEEQFLFGMGVGAGIVSLVMLLVGAWPIPGLPFLMFSGICFMVAGVSMIKRPPPEPEVFGDKSQ
jgi:hypothetical protein